MKYRLTVTVDGFTLGIVFPHCTLHTAATRSHSHFSANMLQCADMSHAGTNLQCRCSADISRQRTAETQTDSATARGAPSGTATDVRQRLMIARVMTQRL